jgi:hypothetical protein
VSGLAGGYHDCNIIDEEGTFKVLGCCEDM